MTWSSYVQVHFPALTDYHVTSAMSGCTMINEPSQIDFDNSTVNHIRRTGKLFVVYVVFSLQGS